MGFLSGVLSNIQGHLGQHKGEITDAIESLNTNKHLGKNGFNAAIVKVVAGVGRYNERVKRSNENVSTPIKTLLNNIGGVFQNKLNDILPDIEKDKHKPFSDQQVEEAVAEIYRKLENCHEFTRNFVNAMNAADADVEDLNDDCRTKVKYAVKSMVRELKLLKWRIKERASREALEQNVSNETKLLKKRIETSAREHITALVDGVKTKILGFRDTIEKEIRLILNTWQLNSSTELITAAGTVRQSIRTFSDQYALVHKELEAIKDIVQESAGNHKLDTLVKNISQAVQRVGADMGSYLQSLNAWIMQAKHALKNAEMKVTAIVSKLEDEGNKGEKNKVTQAAKAFGEKTIALFNAASQAKAHVEGLVSSLPETIIREVHQALKEDLAALKGKCKQWAGVYFGLLNGVDWEDVRRNSDGSVTGLDSFSNKFQEWIKGVKKQNALKAYHDIMLDASLKHLNRQFKVSLGKSITAFDAIGDDVGNHIEKECGAESVGDDGKALTTNFNNATEAAITAKIGQFKNDGLVALETLIGEASPDKIDQKKLQKALSAVTDNLTIFADAVKKLVNGADSFNTDLKSYLTKLDDLLNTKGHKPSFGSHGSVKGIEQIRTDIRSLQEQQLSGKGGNIYIAISQVDAKAALLKQHSTNINNPDSTLHPLIEKLPQQVTTLNDRIRKLVKVVDDAESSLEEWIVGVTAYIASLDQTRESCIKQFSDELEKDISFITSAINHEIRKRYVRFTKMMISEFVGKVNEELHSLPTDIESDRHIGFKGFMEKFYGEYVDTLNDENIKKLSDRATDPIDSPAQKKVAFENLSDKFADFYSPLNNYLLKEITRVNDSENKKKNPVGTDKQPYGRQLFQIYDSLNELTTHIKQKHGYDCMVPGMLDKLGAAIDVLKPNGFSQPSTPIIDCVSSGFTNFVDELRNVYISTYDRQTFEGELIHDTGKDVGYSTKVVRIKELTSYGRKCAKVFFTSLEMMYHDLTHLRKKCTDGREWKRMKIHLSIDTSQSAKEKPTENLNPFGEFMQRCGFRVSKYEDTQDGELRNTLKMQGISAINGVHKCVSELQGGHLDKLFRHLNEYYTVCHYATSSAKRHPCSVSEILIWLSGLPNNSVYHELSMNYFSELFDKPKKEESQVRNKNSIDSEDGELDIAVESGPSIEIYNDLSLSASPHNITPGTLSGMLAEVCAQSHSVLTAIQGHGHADGVYAVDFNTNEYQFSYPGSPAKCFDLLVELLPRVYHQLSFLHTQCHRTYDANSWRDCYYGRYIGGSSWTCNEKQCVNQNCNQKVNQSADQNANQTARQTCDQHPKCGIKSPLQSFLEDGLQGFLPHQLIKVGCGVKCSVSNHGGISCKTPMGFADLSNVASHTKKGDYLMNALDRFCGNPGSPLSQLCKYLTCLLGTPPKTLGDMFAFYYNLLEGWDNQQIKDRMSHTKDAFDDAIRKAYFGVQYDDFDLSSLFNRNHSDHNKHRDLISLVCGGDNTSVTNCGRYLQPISANTWTVFSKRNAGNYLSWIVYLTESFYNLLDQLYKECCKNCTSAGSRCHGKTCVADCTAKSHYASLTSAGESTNPSVVTTEQKHNKLCKPISHCPFTRPTFCKYGFVFKSLSNMSGENGEETMRTCKDLCNALEKVLSNKIIDNAPLAKLVHDVIPKFIWAIREKFFWTTVALWLLSFLYLLHIMVIRLDLLHIKSHLRSPSSHRIAAQSLLAAARVNKLNRVFYLQP